MLDSDLAEFYGVKTKVLNQSVKRNLDCFPDNFMFELSIEEYKILRSQIVTSMINISKKQDRGGQRYLPYVFTEHGVVMLASVLKSKRAAQVSIVVVNAFIKMREYLATHKQIAEKIEKFKRKLLEHDKHLITIYELINKLLEKPKELQKLKQTGFRPRE